MVAALPEKAPAKPRQPRRVLVLGRAAGFVHSSIPLAARTIEEMGRKTGAWSTTDHLRRGRHQREEPRRSTTRSSWPAPPDTSSTTRSDAAATAARRKALLDFVRGGKGLAGIHAASDSYHQARPRPARPRTVEAARPAALASAARRPGRPRQRTACLGRDELRAARGRVVRQARSGEDGTRRTRPTSRSASPPSSRAPPPSSPAAAGRHGLPRAGEGDPARSRHPEGHLARVESPHRRLLQVPLERRAGDHGQGRRAGPSAQRAASRASRRCR